MKIHSNSQCRKPWLRQLPDEMLSTETMQHLQQQVRLAVVAAGLRELCQSHPQLPTSPENAYLDTPIIQN